MARIAGVNIPDRKHAIIALTEIYGIGPTRAAGICDAAKVAKDAKIQDLAEGEIEALRTEVGKFVVVVGSEQLIVSEIRIFEGAKFHSICIIRRSAKTADIAGHDFIGIGIIIPMATGRSGAAIRFNEDRPSRFPKEGCFIL